MPSVIESCWMATREPRRCAGASCEKRVRSQSQSREGSLRIALLSREAPSQTYLGDVHWSSVSQRADRETGDGATAEKEALIRGARLQSGAEDKDDGVELDVEPSTVAVDERAVDERSEPGGEEQSRHPPSLRSR